jgi:hypothetical protein
MATLIGSDPKTTPVVTPNGEAQARRHKLLLPTRGYEVSRNPFAVWEVLPTIVLSFAGIAIAMHFISDAYTATIALGAFLVVTLGTLLVPAISLKGTLNVTHEGLIFTRGKQHLTASWDQVAGVQNRRDCGLTLIITNPQQTTPRISIPGGFRAQDGVARIPLRMFGDRQFSVLYDIRDRLPEAAWREALVQASKRSTTEILLVYAGVVAFAGFALWAVYNIFS